MFSLPRHRVAARLAAGGLAVTAAFAAAPPAQAARPKSSTGRTCTVVGTSGNDRLQGTNGNDVICGLGGNDTIVALGGNDTADGGTGNDRIDGGPGNDTADGNLGNDRLNGGDGDDVLRGGPGADDLRGGTGVDKCTRDSSDTSPFDSCTDVSVPQGDAASAVWVSGPSLDNSTAHTLRMQIHITDDRSGVAAGELVVGSKLLTLTRRVSGTANDGVFEFTGTLPAYAPIGEYQVGYLTVTDRTGNTDVVEGGAMDDADRPFLNALPTFTVTGVPDLTVPELYPATAQWVSGSSLDNSAQRPLALRMRITDDLSGVGSGTLTVGNQKLELTSRVSGTANDGVFEFTGTLPAYTVTGPWKIRRLTVQDRAGSTTEVPHDPAEEREEEDAFLLDQLPTFTVTGTPDLAPPSLDAASVRWANARTLDNAKDHNLRLRMHVTDDRSGVHNGQVLLSGGHLVTLTSAELISGTTRNGVWEFSGTLPRYVATGTYKVIRLRLNDRIGRASILEWDTMMRPGDVAVLKELPTLRVI